MKRYAFGKYVLDVPDDHSILDIHRKDQLYDRLYGSIVERICSTAPRGVVVDVGANIGDTAAMIATHVSNPIVGVEGSEKFLEYLRRNAQIIGPQLTIFDRFVMPSAVKDRSLSYVAREGTGYLTSTTPERSAVPPEMFVDLAGLLGTCQEYGEEIALFKSDTDGCDGFIVAEAMDYLTCPLFFECDANDILEGVPSPWPATFDLLDSRGYAVVVFDNAGLPMCATASNAGTLLRDLSGYITMQRCAGLLKIFYLDVWAFPPGHAHLFGTVSDGLRQRFLKPYGF